MLFYLTLFMININVWVASEDSFSIVYCHNKYKSQRMCDKAVDHSLAALKLIFDWIVTSKMIKVLFTALYVDEKILYFIDDSGDVIFSDDEIGIHNVDVNDINLNKMKMILILLFLSDFCLGISNLKSAKHLKYNK